jgi:hypothetical protein
MHNANIPAFKALIRRSWLTKKQEDKEVFDNIYVFGLQSVASFGITFHCMTDYGMLRSRVPLSEIYTKKPLKDVPQNYKALWDCFSENVSVIKYEYLETRRCKAILRDRSQVWATYMFTVDWFDNPYSEEPSDYKCAHILEADEGYLLALPNNRLYWRDSNWITKAFPIPPQEFKVDTEKILVENQSDRWVSEDTDSYYYDIIDQNKK